MRLDLRPALSAPELVADPAPAAIAGLAPELAAQIRVAGMEHGGIAPLGFPSEWRVLADSRLADLRLAEAPEAIVGARIRGAKTCPPGTALAALPGVETIDGRGRER